MKGLRHSLLALAGVLVLVTAAAAQQPAAAPARLAPPLRGDVELGYTKPVNKNDGKFITTTFKVKNMSTAGSIAGLKIDVFYYDKGGNPVSGDSFRYRKPLQPGEIIDVQLKTPINKNMQQSNYKFEHANGGIKPKLMPKL